MNERSLSVNPVVEPAAGGVIGLGFGYTLAPKKYSLKGLLQLDRDTFEKIYSEEVVENMSQKEKKAFENLKTARNEYRASKNSVFVLIREKARDWKKLFSKVDVSENLTNAYKESRKNLRQAFDETNYIALNKAYRNAKEASSRFPDDKTFSSALTEANSNLSRAKVLISSKIDLYKESVRNIASERLAAVKNNPGKYANVREAYHEFLNALAKRGTAASVKMFELSNNTELKKSYEVLRDFLPRTRTKSALTGAIALGTVTAAIIKRLPSVKNVA